MIGREGLVERDNRREREIIGGKGMIGRRIISREEERD